MAEVEMRIQQAVEELTGNEALLEMLDTEAAAEMLEWGKSMVTQVVKQTADLDDDVADAALAPRLKAVRQSMRSIGNWAAGKYVDAESRMQLRDKLLEQFKLINGEVSDLPSAQAMDTVLSLVDSQENIQQHLIMKMKELMTEPR